MNEKLWFLKRCNLFEKLTEAELARLEACATARSFSKGDIVYFPSEPGRSVLVLTEGRVKLKNITPDGKEAILAFIDEGELFGELAILDEGPRSEYAEAVTKSRILALPRQELLQLMEQRPDVAFSVTKLVGLRRRRIENRLRNIVFRSNRERLAHLLLELVETHGKFADGKWEIGLTLSHQDMAGLIGSTRETVTLALGQLRLEKLISINRRRIAVHSPEALTAEVNGYTLTPKSESTGRVKAG